MSRNQNPVKGLPCPECGVVIAMTLDRLLSPRPLVCPGCCLEIQINREKSEKSLDAVRKIKDAIQNLEAVKQRYQESR